MPRIWVSTTVDETLITAARRSRSELNDAALLDEALASLLRTQRSAQIDASYSAYDDQPLAGPDAWGDLDSFHDSVGAG